MKRMSVMPLLILIISGFIFSGCNNNQRSNDQGTKNTSELTPEQLVQKGEYLISLGGCHDCHSPKQNGPQGPEVIKATMLSGYPSNREIMQGDPAVLKLGWVLFVPDFTSASGPWGVSFAANLTSDQTGIGNWTEENFFRALKEGKFKGLENSRQILPPMPWQNFANAKDEDLRAIFAYLKTVPPVSNIVPAPISNEQPPAQASPTTR